MKSINSYHITPFGIGFCRNLSGLRSRLALISLVFPPIAFYVYHRLRKARALAFENYIARGNHSFLRGPRAQALLESVKCGYDDKYSVAYIDLLYLETTSPPEGLTVGRPSRVDSMDRIAASTADRSD